MGLNGVGFNVRLQVLFSCLHTFRTVLVRRIDKAIKNRDNFPCADILQGSLGPTQTRNFDVDIYFY